MSKGTYSPGKKVFDNDSNDLIGQYTISEAIDNKAAENGYNVLFTSMNTLLYIKNR